MATMHQAGIKMREFACEFEWHTQDVGTTEEDAKIHLVLVLDQDTLIHLDIYITMCCGDEMAHLETIQDMLHHIPYVQMLVHLK